MNWQKLSTVATIGVMALSALFWLFQISAKADLALSVARDNKAAIAAALSSKADSDDVKRLDDDIRELRKSLQDSELIERRR